MNRLLPVKLELEASRRIAEYKRPLGRDGWAAMAPHNGSC